MSVSLTHVHAQAKAFADVLSKLSQSQLLAVPSGHYGRHYNALRNLALDVKPSVDARLLGAFVPVKTLPDGREACDASYVEIETYVRQILEQLSLALKDPANRAATPISATSQVDPVRGKHPQAYAPWTADADSRLRERHRQGASIKELTQEFGRSPGGIHSRLIKLKLIAPPGGMPAPLPRDRAESDWMQQEHAPRGRV